MNLVQFLEQRAGDFSKAIAIIEEQEKVTYAQLWQRVDRLAKAFLELGIKEGDRIAICLPNCQEYIYSFFACLKINAIAVPLKQTITSYELKTILKDCRPSLFITDNIFLKRMLPFDPSIETGKLAVCSKQIMRTSAVKRTIKLEDLFKNSSGLGTTFSADDNTVASINYTYRGYGYPLGAMLTHGNYKAGAEGYVYTVGLNERQKTLLVLPIFHIYSLMSCIVVPFLTKGTIIMADAFPKKVLIKIDREKINVINLIPQFYLSLLRNYNSNLKLSTVSCSSSGGSVLPLYLYSLIKQKFNWEIRQGYGLTECMPIVINPRLGNKPESLGRVGWGVKVKIMDENKREKKIGETGEIVVGGPTIMKGYYRKRKESEAVLKQGWCWTGDYGYFDQQGYLYFNGLKKQIAKVGGNTVDLTEVKNTICRFPGVIEARINTISDEIWGQILTAEVLARNPAEFNLRQLKSFLRDRISSYKVPQLKIAGGE